MPSPGAYDIHDVPPSAKPPGWQRAATARARATLDALEHLVGGLGTGILAATALLFLVFAALTCLIGVGLLLMPIALRVLRVVADRERARLSRWGPEIVGAEPVPARLGDALRDPAVRREVLWLACHGTLGFFLGAAGVTLPLYVVTNGSNPLWWYLLPPGEASDTLQLISVNDLQTALLVSLTGLGWLIVLVTVTPHMAWLQAWPGRRLLSPDAGTDLNMRVAQLTATRAAALDAHAAELRRIERSLHDGTQNRLVAVNVLLGAARRALGRNPADAEAIIDRAQDAAEQALAELRAVVRSILPPVLIDRSLADALSALVADCPVNCNIDADASERCAASVEATAYFVVAEALTNVARHSGAGRATVKLRRREDRLTIEITDDGHGGADVDGGSGLVGIRRRVEAHDGTFALVSPVGGPTTLTVSLPCGS
ncbi:sensor histidine kinase [Plantactinospora soyae]|uniref:histidine kinase n=1 Tax=Plantactinospora soyae TaxID=1544732 RepID=A0A927M1B4_9ACTN|nr:sensor histidine kinase [Plantactinospora soyae]MBE1486292.1 signal transduction histidine kinase [Plantactinospora soyae]